MMNPELLDVIYHGREERNIEYKQSISWDNVHWKAKLTKTIIALSNLTDGGFIVIGVKDQTWEAEGMKNADFDSFNQDDVQSYVNAHVKPYAQFTLSKIENKGKKFIVLQIKEFDLYPVVCSQSGQDAGKGELQEGVFYTRPPRKIESAPIKDIPELEEVISLAVDKWQLHQKQRNLRAGVVSSTVTPKSKTTVLKETLGDFAKWLK